MSSSEKKRKKRSRWGADLDEESDLAEHVGPEDLLQKASAPAAPQFTSPKRKKSRWGGDKVVGDGTADVDALPEDTGAGTVETAMEGTVQDVGRGETVEDIGKTETGWSDLAAEGVPGEPSSSGFSLSFSRPGAKAKPNPTPAPPSGPAAGREDKLAGEVAIEGAHQSLPASRGPPAAGVEVGTRPGVDSTEVATSALLPETGAPPALLGTATGAGAGEVELNNVGRASGTRTGAGSVDGTGRLGAAEPQAAMAQPPAAVAGPPLLTATPPSAAAEPHAAVAPADSSSPAVSIVGGGVPPIGPTNPVTGATDPSAGSELGGASAVEGEAPAGGGPGAETEEDGDVGVPGMEGEEEEEAAAGVGANAGASVTPGGAAAPGETAVSSGASEPPGPRPSSRPPGKEPCSLVVSKIRPNANEQSLRLLFESAGQVLGCKLVKDEVGQHKGFGFVMMASRGEAEAAAEKFNGFQWGDEKLEVTVKLADKGGRPPASNPALPPPPAGVPPPQQPATAPQHQPPPPEPPSTGLPPPPAIPSSGVPSSLPIASAYGGYAFDPFAGAYYGSCGYGYGPAYAAYPTPYPGMPNGMPPGAPPIEPRPPGQEEEEELPPGEERAAREEGNAEEPGPPGESTNDAQDAEVPDEAEAAPPPPPIPPKKEPTVIHVPLKIPEGARKMEEERRKAREAKAKAKARAEAEGGAEGVPTPGVASKPLKAAPVVVGTKGSFQEVLARRQAELAALRNNKAGAASAASKPALDERLARRVASPSRGRSPPRRGYSRGVRRGRSPSYTPSRSPSRGRSYPPRSGGYNSRSPSYSRSPYSRSYSRSPSRSPWDDYRDGGSVGRSPGRFQGEELGRPPSASEKLLRAKKEKKDKKHKKEKKRKTGDRSPPPLGEAPHPAFPEKHSDPAWVEVDPSAAPRRGVILPPLQPQEPQPRSEPEEFRRPSRKRTRTRWHGDDPEVGEGAEPDGNEDQPVIRQKASPQVSEEGEIALEDGEIEGEMLQEPPPRAAPKPGYADPEPRGRYDGRGYREMGGDDRYGYGRGMGRGRGRGKGRGDWGRGPENGAYYPDSRAW